METTTSSTWRCFPVSQPAVPSPGGTFVAEVHHSTLVLRSSCDGRRVHSFSLPPSNNGRTCRLRWSERRRKCETDESRRLLVANDNSVHAFASDDANWKAVINASVSTGGGLANVGFGANEDEVMVLSDFGIKVTIWSLLTSRGIEIRDPKPSMKCHAYRPTTRHLAILVRESAHDNLLLLAPSTYEVLGNVELPTVDAQGLNWSPDSQWLVIWDNASAGYKLYIYTADGNLFKSYAGGQTTDNVGLGIKNIAWSARDDHLAIGDYEDRITIINSKTFHPTFSGFHASILNPDQVTIWEEQIQDSSSRSYVQAIQLSSPPLQSSLLGKSEPITGISLMQFNYDGTLLASRSDTTPTTLWIWSLTTRNPIALLVHHTAIRSIHWHPTIGDLLMIHCALDHPVVHIWKATWDTPKILKLHLDTIGGRLEACWLYTEAHEDSRLMVSNSKNYCLASMNDAGELIPVSIMEEPVDGGPDDRFDQSLIDFSAVKLSYSDTNGHLGQWNIASEVEDTFQHKHPMKLPA